MSFSTKLYNIRRTVQISFNLSFPKRNYAKKEAVGKKFLTVQI